MQSAAQMHRRAPSGHRSLRAVTLDRNARSPAYRAEAGVMRPCREAAVCIFGVVRLVEIVREEIREDHPGQDDRPSAENQQ